LVSANATIPLACSTCPRTASICSCRGPANTNASFSLADCSAAAAGPFGRLQLPWTLSSDAQPYNPARDDANKSGDLAVLEAPTIAGNTYGHTASSIAAVAQADLRIIAPEGQPAAARKALTLVSHPGTIDATERAAIEALLGAFTPYRYDRDAGPLRFVTLAQLAKAYSR